jgi:UDP-N-acetylglucosamine 2-epimerase (non-hydrolysing)
MLDQVLKLFEIMPNYDLHVMQDCQSPVQVAATVLARIEPILRREVFDWVLVQGDTTIVAATAMAAFYCGVKVGHVEAGLRTYDKHHPFPEEVNRRIASVIADIHFAPTQRAKENLICEGVREQSIRVTGNPVIDALQAVVNLPYDPDSGPLKGLPWDRRLILVTAHRRENFGTPLEEICFALRAMAFAHPNDVHIVYPVHLNPNVQEPVHRILDRVPGVTLMDPLEYLPLVYLMKHATLVLTDSGGIQEEAPGLGKPVLVLREVTERPEAVDAGTVRLVGTCRKQIVEWTERLLEDPVEYNHMARAVNPYGDGRAGSRIVESILSEEQS